MRAIILKQDKTTYDSIVFAIEYVYDKQMKEYVSDVYYYVVDDNYKIVRINEHVYGPKYGHTQLLIRNLEPSNSSPWIKEGNFEGYSWFLKSKNTIENIKNNKPIDADIENRCIELNSSNLWWYENNRNSNVIVDDDDIKDVLEFTGWFHDAHIEKIEKKDDGSVHIELSGVWGFERFNLIFKGNTTCIVEDYLESLWMTSASLFIDKDHQICFTTCEDCSSKDELKDCDATKVYADSLKIDYLFDFNFD